MRISLKLISGTVREDEETDEVAAWLKEACVGCDVLTTDTVLRSCSLSDCLCELLELLGPEPG